MGDRNDLKNKGQRHLSKYSNRWSDILLGNQFLKLYFYENGISSSLIVDRMIRADDLLIKKPNEDFKFAIIRSRPNDKNVDLDNDKESADKKFSYSRLSYSSHEKAFEENEFLFFSKINNLLTVNKYNFEYKHQNNRIVYPFEEDGVLNMNTEKILQLAYSGFFNLYNSKEESKETKYFERDDSLIVGFFEKMKSFLKSKPEKESLIKNFLLHEKEKSNTKVEKVYQMKEILLGNNYNSTDHDHHVNSKENLGDNNNNSGKQMKKINKDYFNQEIISHYAEKILRWEMSEAHQTAVLNIRGQNSNPIFSNNDCSGNYSLFFIRNETLWEWREFSGELLKVVKNTKPEFAKDVIHNHIKTHNTESEVFYEDDITIFAELTDHPLENIEASSKNCVLTLIMTLIFLINFFVTFPQKAFFDIRQSVNTEIKSFLLNDDFQLLQTVTNMEEIGKSFLEKWFDLIYKIEELQVSNSTNSNSTNANVKSQTINDNKNSINYLTEDTKSKLLSLSLGVLPEFNMTEMNRSLYIKDVNVFSGMLLSFEFVKTRSVPAASGVTYSDIPTSRLDYYGVISEFDSEIDFRSNDENSVPDHLIPIYDSQRKRYEIYCRPFYSEAEIQTLRKSIMKAFGEKIYELEISPMFFNIDYDTLYSFNLNVRYDAFGTLDNQLYFKAMMPFIKFSQGTFLLILILSIVFILGMVFLGFGHISRFINSILDSINTKSNQLQYEEIFDLSIIILNIISQVYFMVIFIFSSEVFPLKTSTKDEFLFWQAKLDSVNSYQKITGIAIFFMIMRLLKLMMIAFPSFGIVFQTLKFAYKEIIAFFMIVCLMLGGIGSLAHASFGYYSKNYVDLSWAYFHVYLMFVGVFDYKSISNDENSNSLAPIFFVVFMIIFNLILINLFISIILSNYREVKEKYQKFNNVYSIMVQEKIEELTTKVWDLLIFKHPQEVEWEQKRKREENDRLMQTKNKAQIMFFNNNDNNNNNNLDNENLDDSKNKKNSNPAGEEMGEAEKNRTNKPKLSEIGLFEKFKYNFKRLNLKQMLLGEGWNKEEFNTKKIQLLQKMEIRNLEETIKEFSMDYDNEFWHLAKTIFYVFYIVIFIFMMDYQLRLDKNEPVNFDFDLIFGQKFEERYESFIEIEAPLFDFVNQFYDQTDEDSGSEIIIGVSRLDASINANRKNEIRESFNSDNNENYNNKRKKSNEKALHYNSSSKRNLQTNNNNTTINNTNLNQTNNNNSNVNNTNLNQTNSNNTNLNKTGVTGNSTSEADHVFNVDFAQSNCSFEINQIKYRNYIALNYPFFRFTFRLFSVGVNSDPNTLTLFPFVKITNELLGRTNCGEFAEGEFTSPLIYKETINKYSKRGDYDSAFDCGGFVFKYASKGIGCKDDKDTFNYAEQMDEIFKKPNLNSVYLEFPLFNLFEDYAVLTTLSFERNKIGDIIYKRKFDVIPVNRYISKNDFVRTILGSLFLIISIFYLLFIMGNILKYFLDSFQQDFEQDDHKESYKDSFILNKFFRINFNKFKNESLVKSLCDMISTIIMKLLKAIFWLLESLFSYLRSDGYNILDFIYFIITIAMIFAWYSILTLTNELDFVESKSKDLANLNDTEENIRVLSNLRDKYNSYFLFQAINGFFLFLRILGVFKFSQSINNLMTVIYRAKQVVIFHVFSMVFFNIGFCLAGYALFSQNMKEFSTLPYSFLQVLIIVGGNVNMDLFKEESPVFSVFYILFITFSNYLILLNILLSIVVHTFYDVKNENKINFGKEIEEDFLTKIYDIIYKKILLIFERIEVYVYNVLHFEKIANDKTMQFKTEMNERESQRKDKGENKKVSIENQSKKLSFYELFFNLRDDVDKLSVKADNCEFTQGQGEDRNPPQDKDRSSIPANSNSSNFKQKKPPKITILEKIFSYIYIVLFEEVPKASYLFKKTEDLKLIKAENMFYSKRFENDVSDKPKDEDTIKIKNLYIQNFLIKLKQDIIKKPNSFFSNNYGKKLKKYLASSETLKEKQEAEEKMKDLNFQLFYSKKSREPLDYFENILYTDDLYKVGKTAFSKILNIIIFTEKKKIETSSNLNVSQICNVQSIKDIYFNNNFKDILEFKVLKFLKFCSMTYDLVVKHYYLPKEVKLEEKNAYLGFYLQKFLERQFNQIEIQYMNQNIPDIKESLFENDILKLLEFDFNVNETEYAPDGTLETYITDELLSIRNEAFSDENDVDEFAHKHKKRIINDNNRSNLITMNNNNNVNNNNLTRRFNTNYITNQKINETVNNNNPTAGAANKIGFNNANLSYHNTGNHNNPKDFDAKNLKEQRNIEQNSMTVTEQNVELLPSFKEKCLKIFSVWNTLFIVLFRKDFNYVRFLENLSFSKQLIKQYEEKMEIKEFDENDICFKSRFLYLFSRLFFLEQPLGTNVFEKNNSTKANNQNTNNNINKSNNKINFVFKKIDKNIKKLNEIRLLGKLDENDITSPVSNFYANINEYLFDTPDIDFEKNIKEAGQKSINNYRAVEKLNNFYPGIFSKIWSTLDESTKKVLFFGLNEDHYQAFIKNDLNYFSNITFFEDLIDKIERREEIFEEDNKSNLTDSEKDDYKNHNNYNDYFVEKNNDVYNLNSLKYRELKIIPFFRSEQRSHIFNYLKFPSERFDECKKAILALPTKGITLDDIDRHKNFETLFKFINESKFSLKYKYDVYNAVFDKLFMEIKLKLKEVSSQFEKLLDLLIKNNKDFFNFAKNRIKFIKFFKYVLTMKKYDAIKNYVLESSNKNNTDAYVEKEYLDNLAKDNELIIYVLSLPPMDLIEIIRKSENEDIRETFTFLFIYIYSGTQEFQNTIKYLKKFIKTGLTVKYEKYAKLLEIKEKMKSNEEKILNNHKKFSNMQEYKKELEEKIRELVKVRDNTLNQLEKKINIDANKEQEENDI